MTFIVCISCQKCSEVYEKSKEQIMALIGIPKHLTSVH